MNSYIATSIMRRKDSHYYTVPHDAQSKRCASFLFVAMAISGYCCFLFSYFAAFWGGSTTNAQMFTQKTKTKRKKQKFSKNGKTHKNRNEILTRSQCCYNRTLATNGGGIGIQYVNIHMYYVPQTYNGYFFFCKLYTSYTACCALHEMHVMFFGVFLFFIVVGVVIFFSCLVAFATDILYRRRYFCCCYF